MTPDAAWPNLPNYGTFSAADHAAHRSPKGIAYPEHVGMVSKAHKQLMKVAKKPHLKLTSPKRGKKKKV